MTNYIQSALKKVLEGEYDISEHTCGNYHVWMKYDGYSAMVDINYIKNGIHSYQICQWDSLDRRITLTDKDCLQGIKSYQLKRAIKSIQNLGYTIKEIVVESLDKDSVYENDITQVLSSQIKA